MKQKSVNTNEAPLTNLPDVSKVATLSLRMLEKGIPQHKILETLIDAAEIIAGNDSVCSILVLDRNGLLRNGSSPKLPYDYLTAIDGIKPNPKVGTCASAAATGEVTITEDFQADGKWDELRHLPIALGFISAWSMPIKTTEGKVLGTFGTYYRDRRKPSTSEIDDIKILADAAAKILVG